MNDYVKILLEYWVIVENLQQEKRDFKTIFRRSGFRSFGANIEQIEQYFDDVIERVLVLMNRLHRDVSQNDNLTEGDKALLTKFKNDFPMAPMN